MVELSEVEKAYLAGLFDGEGCIACNFHSGGSIVLSVRFCNTNEAAVFRMYQLFEGSFNVVKWNPRNMKKRLWQWSLGGGNCRFFLETLLPYLKIKKKQAELALAYTTLIVDFGQKIDDANKLKRELLRQAITSLNHAGEIPLTEKEIM